MVNKTTSIDNYFYNNNNITIFLKNQKVLPPEDYRRL